jgi:PHP family Zn ribbon phosphoesterase
LKKNPNKVGKVVKRIVDEINFGSNLGVLIQQARDELKKMDGMMANV